MKQAELAKRAGISPSYLNLIEHNRRRIGGKLVVDIAAILGTDVSHLTEGAEAALVDALRDVAAKTEGNSRDARALPELDRIDEFVGRFPGWAARLAAEHATVTRLEHMVETLTDRLTHDPFLSASMHELLSTVTAIRSTASILADEDDLDEAWQRRFSKNLKEDSRRLADSAQALVGYLDETAEDRNAANAPQEELDAYLAERNYHVAELERALPPNVDQLIKSETRLRTPAVRALAERYFTRYRADVVQLPLDLFVEEARALSYDPGRLAERFDARPQVVFRRLASLATEPEATGIGLVLADGAGAISFRKPVGGFRLPLFGAACPLWPLYQALARPMQPIRTVIEQSDSGEDRFLVYAISEPRAPLGFSGPQVHEAAMLILSPSLVPPDTAPEPVGVTCRFCARENCPARREPSIV